MQHFFYKLLRNFVYKFNIASVLLLKYNISYIIDGLAEDKDKGKSFRYQNRNQDQCIIGEGKTDISVALSFLVLKNIITIIIAFKF